MFSKWIRNWHERNCPECRYRRKEEIAWEQCVRRMLMGYELAHYSKRQVDEFVDSLQSVPDHRHRELVRVILRRVGQGVHPLEEVRERLEYRIALYFDARSIYREQIYGGC